MKNTIICLTKGNLRIHGDPVWSPKMVTPEPWMSVDTLRHYAQWCDFVQRIQNKVLCCDGDYAAHTVGAVK